MFALSLVPTTEEAVQTATFTTAAHGAGLYLYGIGTIAVLVFIAALITTLRLRDDAPGAHQR